MEKNIGAMTAFILAAIATLRNTSKGYYGIHTVYSKVAAAFAAEFHTPLYTSERNAKGKWIGMSGPLAAMVEAGAVSIRPVTGGFMLYIASERSAAAAAGADKRSAAAAAEAVALASRIKAAAAGGVRAVAK